MLDPIQVVEMLLVLLKLKLLLLLRAQRHRVKTKLIRVASCHERGSSRLAWRRASDRAKEILVLRADCTGQAAHAVI